MNWQFLFNALVKYIENNPKVMEELVELLLTQLMNNLRKQAAASAPKAKAAVPTEVP